MSSCGNTLDILQGIGQIGQSVVDITKSSNSYTTSTYQDVNEVRTPQRKKIKVERECVYCKGNGICFACQGSRKSTETLMGVRKNCKWCHGGGKCYKCKGKGVLVSYNEVYE